MENPGFVFEPESDNGLSKSQTEEREHECTTYGACARTSVSSSASKKKSKCQRALSFVTQSLKLVTIEPIIFCHMTSLLVISLAYNDFVLDRICRQSFKYNDEVCDALAARQTENFTVEETNVQKEAAAITTWRFGIEYSVPTVLVLFMGAWSDIYGRKLPLILTMVGTVIKAGMLLMATYFDDWDGTIVALCYTIPSSLTGSFPLFTMAFHSYLADTTSQEHRTVRFGIAGAFVSIGVAVGSAFGGFLLSKQKLGFGNTFLIAAGLEMVVILLSWVFIKNTIGGGRSPGQTKGSDDDISIGKNQSSSIGILAMFKITRLFDAFKILFISRPSSGRLKLWFFLLIFICSAAPSYGESSVLYLFLRRQLNWEAGQYGSFALYQTIAAVVGVLLSVGVLSYWFKMHDAYIGFLGCISQIISSVMYAFAKSTAMIYSAPLVDIMNGAMVVAVRSMATKSVDVDEQGKIISIFAGIDAVNPIIANVAYAGLYWATLEYLPGAFFLLSAALALPPLVIYGIFSLNVLKDSRKTLAVNN